MDKLLEIVLPRIVDILSFSGSVLGHYDGIQKPFFEEPALTSALEEMGLRDWLTLFDSDYPVCGAAGKNGLRLASSFY